MIGGLDHEHGLDPKFLSMAEAVARIEVLCSVHAQQLKEIHEIERGHSDRLDDIEDTVGKHAFIVKLTGALITLLATGLTAYVTHHMAWWGS